MAEVPHGQDIGRLAGQALGSARQSSMRPPSDSSALRMQYWTTFCATTAVWRSPCTCLRRGNTCSVSRNRACDSSRMQDQQASPSPVQSETLPSQLPTPAGALHRPRRRLGRVRREPLENVLECRLAHLRCVGEQLSQLLDLHLGGQVLFGAARRLLFGCQVCSPPPFSTRAQFTFAVWGSPSRQLRLWSGGAS
jgi:hypothetical protein